MSTGSKLFKTWIKGTPTSGPGHLLANQSAGSPFTSTMYHGPFSSSGTQLPSSLPKQVTIAATNNTNINIRHPGVLGGTEDQQYHVARNDSSSQPGGVHKRRLGENTSTIDYNYSAEGSLNHPPDDVLELKEVVVTQSMPVYAGTYSTVYRGIWNNQEVAIKAIRAVGSIKKARRRLRRESQIWAQLQHPNVAPLYGLCLDAWFGEYGALVSPWCAHGGSHEYLKRLSDNPRERIQLANILIDSNGTAKLCDFGLIRVVQEGDTGMATSTPHTGTARYLSHELVTDENATPTVASDSHALGCIGLEFAYLKRPYTNRNFVGKIYSDISNGVPPAKRPAGAGLHRGHAALWVLLEWCWALEPNNRPTCRSICRHLSLYGDDIIEALEENPLA
ncbi:hypothetical protein FRC16_000285 [Serendipita sp. 398]|nr:hypothetical protein FRC16_000285 [Serendipita sp. 398]